MHRIDHWKLNRSAVSRFARLRVSMATHREALTEIRAARYDAAVDLYPFYPNMALLFARAGIPIRVGYESGGGSPLYTRPIPWIVDRQHMMAKQLSVLSELLGVRRPVSAYSLPPITSNDDQRASDLLSESALAEGFVVLHPGTGNALKAWPIESWRQVATGLLGTGRQVAVTGSGRAEQETASWLRRQDPAVVDLTGRTTVGQLRAILRRASVVVASDSAAGHLAAAGGTPVVSIMAGMSDPAQWKPLTETGVALTASVPCAPCFRPQGCAGMNCVRDVTVNRVLEAATQVSSSVF